MPEEKSFVVVVWGDSIAANNGNLASGWPAICESLANAVSSTGRRVIVHNEGICGKSAALAIGEFEARIKPYHPNLVIIQFGANDIRHELGQGGKPLSTEEEFIDHLTVMIRACQNETRATVVVFGYHRPRRHLILPNGLTYQAALSRYNNLAAAVASTCGVTFFDLSAELPYDEYDWKDLVCEDGIHLSAVGNTAYADFAANLILRHLQAVPMQPAYNVGETC
jgi:lysophospholipase L1-like esterase